MFSIAVKVAEGCTVNVEVTEEEALRKLLVGCGIRGFLVLVRGVVEELADPTQEEHSTGTMAYAALTGLDQAIMDTENV